MISSVTDRFMLLAVGALIIGGGQLFGLMDVLHGFKPGLERTVFNLAGTSAIFLAYYIESFRARILTEDLDLLASTFRAIDSLRFLFPGFFMALVVWLLAALGDLSNEFFAIFIYLYNILVLLSVLRGSAYVIKAAKRVERSE